MQTLITIVHVIVAIFLCLVVLLQSGRGGGMGAAFGGAGSQIFGGRGAGNFLTKLTSGAAIVFFVTSLTLTMMSSRHKSVVTGKQEAATAPAGASDTDVKVEDGAAAQPEAAPADGAEPPANPPAHPEGAPAGTPAPQPEGATPTQP